MVEKELKKGFNFYLYYWTIPAFFIFFLIDYFSSFIKLPNLDLDLMISIVSFLFGFLISITFSLLFSKVNALREALNFETARIINLINLSKNLGENFHKEIKEKIDKYTIVTLRHYLDYHFGRDIFYSIYDSCNKMELNNEIKVSASKSFFYNLGEWSLWREKLESLTKTRIEPSLKVANYALGSIFILLLYLNRGDFFSNFLFITLSTVTIFIFLIMKDYDDLRIGDYNYNISNSEEIFDALGFERYYPEEIVNRVKLVPGNKYRIGFLNEDTNKEEIHLLTYNPKFNFKIKEILNRIKKRKNYV